MADVSIRDLRNRGGNIVDRVIVGEKVTITRSGKAIAQLVPLPEPPLSSSALLERWKTLPHIDPIKFRSDIDAVLDTSI